jgi:predicted RNA-binding protein associated with RNAse of E/G family
VIDDLLAKNGDKMTRLLDLYLDGEFERDMLVARHAQLEKMIVDLEQERADLMATLQAGTLSEAQIATILDVAREIHAHLEGGEADFERRRNVIEMLDVRGVLQVEDGGQKVIRARSNITTLQRDVPLSDVSPISKNQ